MSRFALSSPIFLAPLLSMLFAGGCTGTSTGTSISPITGILVRSESLVSGHGCGQSAQQLFRYAAVVEDDTGRAYAGGTYDCFADAAFTFGNVIPDGTRTYRVHVFAFNRVAYEAQNTNRTIDTAGADLDRLRQLKPTWRTDCDATPLPNVQVLAVCPALSDLGTGTASLAMQTFTTSAGPLTCGTGFTKVHVAQRGATRTFDAECTASPLRMTDLPAPAQLTFDVELRDASDAATARGRCTASTSSGLDVLVTCAQFSSP